MKYTLRNYQIQAAEAALQAFRSPRNENGLLILPTGAGKSLVVSEIAFQLKEPILVFCPSKELIVQDYEKMCSYGVFDCGVYSASVGTKDINKITFATIGSVMNHIHDFDHFKYVMVDECFPYETFISTELGKRRIGQLYNMFVDGKHLPKVLSYDEKTGRIIPSTIERVFCNGEKEVQEYKFSNNKVFSMTANHPLLTDRGWIKASDLQKGDIALCSSNKAQRTLRPNADQMAFLLGSVLGDGSLDKTRKFASVNRMRFRQGIKQYDYLYWKACLMNRQDTIKRMDNVGYSCTTTFSFDTTCLIIRDEMLTKEYAIRNLDWKSLAILYMDDGHMNEGQNGGTICSVADSEELTHLLVAKLNSMGLDCSFAKARSSSTQKPYYYVRFRKDGLVTMCRMIAKYCHPNLMYKIIDECKHLVGTYHWDNRYLPLGGYAFQEKGNKRICVVYNMEVSNTHTYVISSGRYDKTQTSYVDGAIVHNCHNVNAKGGQYEEFIHARADRQVVGLTATPYRLGKGFEGTSMLKFLTRTRPRIFQKVLYYCQISELLAKGYLADLKYYDLTSIDLSKVRSNSTGADYDDRSLTREYERSGFYDKLTTTTLRVLKPKNGIPRKGVLVFTRFTKEAELLVGKLKYKGVHAAVVSAQTPKAERDQIITDFKSMKIQVVANVGVLSTGFDHPALDTVILARPTKSLALYYQMVGRAIRPYKDKDGWVIDLGGSYKQFGKVQDLKIGVEKPNSQLWAVFSNGKQLTNRSF